jgi:hypothetical protein
MSITDGAKKLYRDSKLGLSVSAIVAILAAAGIDATNAFSTWLTAAVGVLAGTVAGAITAWSAKRSGGTSPAVQPSSRLTRD